ncbi:hypothetical protein TRFO_20235 [Tritrichomonas foetus]|uniref:Uncharacterized protein n=1 Tax=Tritrichomonas foetus TaxID=1144522 RepID=A0A1J4KGI7_9EUKA|nr:hypothetical protein TRFO_20235 [Tritrichomonas foetus]|eukprot:OHT10481.1 hypothetical protein TRFO_20235 [Tritrichomonas foetus]
MHEEEEESSHEQNNGNIQDEDYEYDNSNQEFEMLNQEIEDLKYSISDYYVDINKTLYNIQKALDKCTIIKATIKSIQAAPPLIESPSGRSSRTSSRSMAGEDQILQKHQLKLDGKLKEIHKLQSEINQNQITFDNLEDRLRALLNDECEIQINLNTAEAEIREYNINREINRRRVEFMKNQVKERKKELQQLRVLKSDAQNALSMLEEREKSCSMIDDQNASEKVLTSRQNELVRLETEIQAVRRRMYEFKEYAMMEALQYQSSIQDHEYSANWEEEKSALTSALNELKQKVRILKQYQVYYVSDNIQPNDPNKTISLTPEEKDIYGSLIRKWAKEANEEELYEGKINTGWKIIQEKRILLAKLMEENVKKAKQLSRRKEALQLTVEKFRKKENDLVFDSQKRAIDFEEQEKKMIEKIRRLKIKLAQIRLDRERH